MGRRAKEGEGKEADERGRERRGGSDGDGGDHGDASGGEVAMGTVGVGVAVGTQAAGKYWRRAAGRMRAALGKRWGWQGQRGCEWQVGTGGMLR